MVQIKEAKLGSSRPVESITMINLLVETPPRAGVHPNCAQIQVERTTVHKLLTARNGQHMNRVIDQTEATKKRNAEQGTSCRAHRHNVQHLCTSRKRLIRRGDYPNKTAEIPQEAQVKAPARAFVSPGTV